MRFERIIPTERLRPYIKYFCISDNKVETEYKVFPSSALVIGFQYRGQLSIIEGDTEIDLSTAGITGISNRYKLFKNSEKTETILVYFTETGFTHFTSLPANELFDKSVSLSEIFGKRTISDVEEKLAFAGTEKQRIRTIEQFLIAQLQNKQADKLIIEAVKIIYQKKGTIRIKELNKLLAISQSPFEKRFRALVGTTPKKFASIVRFNAVLEDLGTSKSLAEVCYDNNFFDQAHFLKDFKQSTGETPENFKRIL